MKISIITPTKNSAATIRDTIESVISQTGVIKEYIIIDGMSTDGTLDIISEYNEEIDSIISENDSGLYHAINKGIFKASGDIIAILNSDDIYTDNDCLSSVINTFKTTETQIVYGNISIVDNQNENKVIRKWTSHEFDRSKVKWGWCPPHPGFFVTKEMYLKYGNFDTKYKISADYDLMLRFILAAESEPIYLDKNLVRMRSGGESRNDLKGIFRKLKEDVTVLRKNNLPVISGILGKKLSKLKQFIV